MDTGNKEKMHQRKDINRKVKVNNKRVRED
jgi:hypothetical protein